VGKKSVSTSKKKRDEIKKAPGADPKKNIEVILESGGTHQVSPGKKGK